jgi:Uma2 family endonuclease
MSALPQSSLPQQRMSVEEFLAWSESQEGRYELVDGVIYAQAAERVAHSRIKGLVFLVLRNVIKTNGLDCEALPDGVAIRVGARTVFEPDALVYCGPKLPPDTLLIENPVIVVEVISPTTGRNDHTRKVAGYFRLPSVRHYLIVDPDDPLIVHHARGEDGVIRTKPLTEGVVALDPPGIAFSFADIYETG